jgi:hypothetical protein
MGAVRLYFEKNLDSWEYGYLTVHTWMALTTICAISGEDNNTLEYFIKHGGHALLRSLSSGEASLTLAQSVIFFQATDLISKILVGSDIAQRKSLFCYIQQHTERFRSIQQFEAYYLDYSSSVLELVRTEFEKEPELRGGLDRLLGSDDQ